MLSDTSIGWDFDGTLIDHPAAERMHAFIKATPERRHIIITFRTHLLFRMIARDLSVYPDAPPIDVFESIKGIEDRRWSAFERARTHRLAGMLKGPLTPDEIYYVEWKGDICKRLGLTVLVDDNIPHTQPGCVKFGIELVHPDEFL